MNNVLPMFRDCAEHAPVFVSPELQPFLVTLAFAKERHEMNVLAFKSCDAICNAIDLFFDGEYEMPESMTVKAHPANVLRSA